MFVAFGSSRNERISSAQRSVEWFPSPIIASFYVTLFVPFLEIAILLHRSSPHRHHVVCVRVSFLGLPWLWCLSINQCTTDKNRVQSSSYKRLLNNNHMILERQNLSRYQLFFPTIVMPFRFSAAAAAPRRPAAAAAAAAPAPSRPWSPRCSPPPPASSPCPCPPCGGAGPRRAGRPGR